MIKKFIGKLKKKLVHGLTKKPECYVRVDKPKTLQDHRQVWYNKWCKVKGVYNGSYLPKNPKKLLKKGWVETTSADRDKNKTSLKDYQRKSSGQMVSYEDGKYNKRGVWEDRHYHWLNGKTKKEHRKLKDDFKRIDRYGKVCHKDSKQSHLAPLDKDYKFRR